MTAETAEKIKRAALMGHDCEIISDFNVKGRGPNNANRAAVVFRQGIEIGQFAVIVAGISDDMIGVHGNSDAFIAEVREMKVESDDIDLGVVIY